MEKEKGSRKVTLPHDHGTGTAEVLQHGKLGESFGENSLLFEEAADAFAMLADANRLKIFTLLCHTEDCVTNIAAAVGMSLPAVSHHLKILKTAHLLESRKCGKEVYYGIADNHEAYLIHKIVDSIMDMKCE
ncbi:MAG: winged helix-turn-helix transcriptional regulator [Firmicutes bacterium]|nr:winged helix-turn-helix transcriptional regulator [Bacillota bacterium]